MPFSKKKKSLHSESSSNLSIFVPKFSDLPITCAIAIIFSKSFAALLGFSKFCGTKHKMPTCFATHSLRSPELMEREIAYFMYKYCDKHLPAAFEGMLNKNTLRLSSKESRKTRSKSSSFPLFYRIDLTKQYLSYKGPLIWNKISQKIRENKSFRSFRKQYH